MPEEVDHYTVVIEVHEIKKLPPSATRTAAETPRNKVELARFVIRAKTMDEIKQKVSGHIVLLNES